MFLTLLIGLLGIAAGALITWKVAKHYYERAGQDLKEEAAELRRLSVLVLRGLENARILKLNRDEKGNIKGLSVTVEIKSALHMQSSLTGRLSKKGEDEGGGD